MKLKWVENQFGSNTYIGPFRLSVCWGVRKGERYVAECHDLFRVSNLPDMNQAKEAAENELRKVLTQALEKLT